MKEEYTTSSTSSTSKYNDFFLDEIAYFVYGASSEEEAIENAQRIFKKYERHISFKRLLYLLLNK